MPPPSSKPRAADDQGLRFAERLLSLIDSGRYSATYKFATLLAILDLAAENTDSNTGPPDVLHGREVAARVIELYWPQSAGYAATADSMKRTLSQSPQNDIPAKLARWRRRHRLGDGATLTDAERADPKGWSNLVAELTATVIGMPLAKLQKFGDGRNAVEDRFIYDFKWAEEVKRPTVERIGFDDRLYLRPGVGEWLVRLTPLLRPLVEAKWTKRVAERNPEFVDHQLLDAFLFGADRINLDRVRGPLLDLQEGYCFYCLRQVRQLADVDHFLPWSRHPDNTLDNLVAAHRACNGAKSASIAGLDHLQRWLERSHEADSALAGLATSLSWPRKSERTIATARAVYLWLPTEARLWIAGTEFEAFDIRRARTLLAA
jgi:hypothetical protein